MRTVTAPTDKTAVATRALAQLNRRARALRSEVAQLELSLVTARENAADTNSSRQLREANERLVSAIALGRRHRSEVAVLFCDLDHFKPINDALGHGFGDEVLKIVARRLEAAVRGSDTVSRYGGDEFLIVLADVASSPDAAVVAKKVLAALAMPIEVFDHQVQLSASIGIALFPEDGADAELLIGLADAAMYRSKKQGRGRFAFHNSAGSNDSPLGQRDAGPQQPQIRGSLVHATQEPRLAHLREANEQLVMAALTAQALESEARESTRRQVNLLAVVAHELRSPLTPMRTAAELLKHAHQDSALLDQAQLIIRRQVTHMSRLVDDLLDGSRVSAGKFRLEFSKVELADILDAAIETVMPAVHARHQHLTMQLPPGALSLQGDPIYLTQIFSNLLDNSSKYTPDGGQISISAGILDHAVVLTIADTGIGIKAEALPTIFDLFVQDERAAKHDTSGLGVGLAVVRDLVEAHGGTVVGKSAGENRGSEFVVMLPLVLCAEVADG